MTPDEFENHPGWRWCTAQGARDQVLLQGLQTTFREKLEWLEEMQELSGRLQSGSVIYPASAGDAPSLNDSEPGPPKGGQ